MGRGGGTGGRKRGRREEAAIRPYHINTRACISSAVRCVRILPDLQILAMQKIAASSASTSSASGGLSPAPGPSKNDSGRKAGPREIVETSGGPGCEKMGRRGGEEEDKGEEEEEEEEEEDCPAPRVSAAVSACWLARAAEGPGLLAWNPPFVAYCTGVLRLRLCIAAACLVVSQLVAVFAPAGIRRCIAGAFRRAFPPALLSWRARSALPWLPFPRRQAGTCLAVAVLP